MGLIVAYCGVYHCCVLLRLVPACVNHYCWEINIGKYRHCSGVSLAVLWLAMAYIECISHSA